MKYIVRINPRAINPLTRKVVANRVWEVEQVADKDSEKVIWHCAAIRVDKVPIWELYRAPHEGEKPWEAEYFGICIRGQDNVVDILTRGHDGNN